MWLGKWSFACQRVGPSSGGESKQAEQEAKIRRKIQSQVWKKSLFWLVVSWLIHWVISSSLLFFTFGFLEDEFVVRRVRGNCLIWNLFHFQASSACRLYVDGIAREPWRLQRKAAATSGWFVEMNGPYRITERESKRDGQAMTMVGRPSVYISLLRALIGRGHGFSPNRLQLLQLLQSTQSSRLVKDQRLVPSLCSLPLLLPFTSTATARSAHSTNK